MNISSFSKRPHIRYPLEDILCKLAGTFPLSSKFSSFYFHLSFLTEQNDKSYCQLSYKISQTLIFMSPLRISAVFCLDFSFKIFVLKYNICYFEIETSRIKYLFICEVQFNNELRMDFNCDHQLGKIL